jgi:hypothetical protein
MNEPIPLRDIFAAFALSGFLAGYATQTEGKTFEEWSRELARASYTHADAMLAERAKGKAQ